MSKFMVWKCRLPGRLPAALQRRVAHRLLEQPERRQVLGRAPGDEAGPVAAAPEPERQRPERHPGQPVEEVERQPGEPRAGCQQEQPGRIGAEKGLHPPAGPCVERVQDPVQGRRAAAGLLLAAGLVCAAAPAAAQEAAEVPQFWPLVPSGLGPGDKFRLLFVTSRGRDATSTDIADYNAFVQGRAESGHSAIREFASKFRVLGSTASVDARDNTGTTSSDTDAKIYWLNGSRVAASYADFYDGSWSNKSSGKNENGGGFSRTANIWTGSSNDGTANSGNELGARPTGGRPFGSAKFTQLGIGGTLSTTAQRFVNFEYSLFALSPVFTIVRAAKISGVSIPSSPASGDSYGAGETVRVRLTFSEAVDVTGKPHVWLNVGGAARRADHVSGSGTKDLEFAYTVLAEDFDADGVRLCSSTALNAGCGRVSLNGGTVAASSDGFAPDLDHPEQDDQSGDKVDGGSAGPASGVPTIAGTPRVPAGRCDDVVVGVECEHDRISRAAPDAEGVRLPLLHRTLARRMRRSTSRPAADLRDRGEPCRTARRSRMATTGRRRPRDARRPQCSVAPCAGPAPARRQRAASAVQAARSRPSARFRESHTARPST